MTSTGPDLVTGSVPSNFSSYGAGCWGIGVEKSWGESDIVPRRWKSRQAQIVLRTYILSIATLYILTPTHVYIYLYIHPYTLHPLHTYPPLHTYTPTHVFPPISHPHVIPIVSIVPNFPTELYQFPIIDIVGHGEYVGVYAHVDVYIG